jgi:predicted AAA+ superfamily ATPase
MQGISETLAGRVAILRLDPLSTREALSRAPLPVGELLARTFSAGGGQVDEAASISTLRSVDWLLRGGYPEPRLNPAVDRVLWFSSYVQTYLQRDVRDILRVGDLDSFSRFVFLVASRTGSILNMADLGRDAGVTGPTVRQWMSVLDASQIIYLLRPWHRNLGKRIRRSPKIYMIDPGLATFLLGLHSGEAVQQGPSHGGLMETAVIGEWIKAFRSGGLEPPLYYWQTDRSGEIDLVIEHDARVYAMEIKATSTPTPQHAQVLDRWSALLGGVAGAAVACNVDRPMTLAKGVRAVPWHLSW